MSTTLERGELDEVTKKPEARRDLSIRAVIFGILLGLFGVWAAGVQGEVYGHIDFQQNIMFTSEEPINLGFVTALATLFIMCVLVPKIFPKLKIGFSRAELIVTFAVGLGVHTIGFGVWNVISTISGFGFYAITSSPALQAWEGTYSFVVPKDFDVIMDLQMGWVAVPWRAWVVPLIFWFFVLFFLTCIPLCMGVIMRKRWAEHEQLTFPLARAVIHVLDVEDDGTGRLRGFWKNKLLWIGAAITFTLIFYEWVRLELAPGLPLINRHFIASYLQPIQSSSPALNYAMSSPQATGQWFRSWGVTGVLYLAPSHDFLFTWILLTPVNWFANYILYYVGPPDGSANLLSRASSSFSLISLALYMGWRARAEISSSLRKAFSKKVANKDMEDEGLTIREAVFGMLIGAIAIYLIFVFVLKISFGWALAFLLTFYFFAFSISRFRAEVAFPSAGFLDIRICQAFLMRVISPQIRAYPLVQPSIQTMAGLGFFSYHQRKYGPTLAMANILEGCKMADETNLKRRTFTKSYMIGFVLAAIPTAVMFLKGFYDVGMGMPRSTFHYDLFSRLSIGQHVASDGSILGYSPTSWTLPYGLTFSVLVVFFAVLRAKYIWWPFHPIGLIMANTNNMGAHIAGAGLVTLISKAAILRYGGGALYIKLTPFFIGLVLGEALAFIARWLGMAILNTVG